MLALSALAVALRRPPRCRFVAAALLLSVCVAGATLVAQGQAQQPASASQNLPSGVRPPEVTLVTDADMRSYVGWTLLGFSAAGIGIAFGAGAFRSRIVSEVKGTRKELAAFRTEWQADRVEQARRLDEHSETLTVHRRDLDVLRVDVDWLKEGG